MDLSPNTLGLLLIDIQEKLFPKVHEHEKLLQNIEILQKGCKLLLIPSLLTEQYPQGLGKTMEPLREGHKAHEKTTFSCFKDPKIQKELLAKESWIIAGIESHICVFQTVQDLLHHNKKCIVIQNAISSRNVLDHNSALQEMRALGARITTVETLLFEMVQDAKNPHFKAISGLVK